MKKKLKFFTKITLVAASSLFSWAVVSAQTSTPVTIVHSTPIVTPADSVYEFAVPQKMGYYKSEKVDPSFNQSASIVASAQALQSGTGNFAVTNPEVIMQMREQGGDLIGVMTLKPDNGVIMAVLDDSPIKKLEDLRGKTVGGFAFGGGGGLLLTKVLTKMGIAPTEYSRVVTGIGGAAATSLRTNKVDALILWDSAFATLENAGLKLRYIRVPEEENLAGLVLATTERFLKENPAAIEGTCRAIAKGLYFTRMDPATSMRIFLEIFPTSIPPNADKALIAKQYTHTLQAYLKGGFKDLPIDAKVGMIDEAKWNYTKAFYVESGMLKGTKPVSQAYTTQFIDKCNDFDRKTVADDFKRYQDSIR